MPAPEAPAAPPARGGATSGPATPAPRWPARPAPAFVRRAWRAALARRWIVGLLLAAAYAVASHVAMTHAGHSVPALLFVLGPLVGLGLLGLWARGQRVAAVAGVLLAAACAALVAQGRTLDPRLLYLAQHAGVHLALGLWFGSTLRPGRQPLISSLAALLHGGLDATLAAYTRQVTKVWTLYFFAMAAISLLLFCSADFALWSAFANLLTPVSAAALFAGEYLLRYRLHPEFERVSLADGIRAYRSLRAGPPATDPEPR